MSAWHLDNDLAARYVEGTTDLALAASVEAHLMKCAACRQSVAGAVSVQRLDDIWARVTDTLDASSSPAERLWRRWRMPPLSAKFAIALAATAVYALAPLDLGTDRPADGQPSPSGLAPTRPAVQDIQADDAVEMAALIAGLTTVDGRLVSSDDPPPYRVRLDNTIYTPASVTERNVLGLDYRVVPRSAVIHSASGTWVYTVPGSHIQTSTGSHIIVRQRVTVFAENDGLVALSIGPSTGTGVLTFTID